jgi:hypothetical protein
MGCEGNETFSNGESEPHMRRVNESPSVWTCTVLSERDLRPQPGVPKCDGSGDDKEHRDEVLAVIVTPVYSGEPGHDVSGGGPERNEVK